MSLLMPAPTKRVHVPSDVATHGVALASAGESPFRSARIVMALRVACRRGVGGHATKAGNRAGHPFPSSAPRILVALHGAGSAAGNYGPG
jgi:hypothetical protein